MQAGTTSLKTAPRALHYIKTRLHVNVKTTCVFLFHIPTATVTPQISCSSTYIGICPKDSLHHSHQHIDKYACLPITALPKCLCDTVSHIIDIYVHMSPQSLCTPQRYLRHCLSLRILTYTCLHKLLPLPSDLRSAQTS